MKWNGNLSLVSLPLDIEQNKNYIYIEFFFLMFIKKCAVRNVEMAYSHDEQLAH